MNKQERAAYLASLLTIMVSKETAALPRGKTLTDEYNFNYDELVKEIKDEAGKRSQQPRGDTSEGPWTNC